jgi:hypothetical protein
MQIFTMPMEGLRSAAIKFSAAVLPLAGAAVLLLSVPAANAQTAPAPAPAPATSTSAVPAPSGEIKISNTGIDEPTPVTYTNKFEAYGGVNLMEFHAGEIPYRSNLGGVELLGTWWATHHIGVGVDIRGEAGTTKTTTLTYFPLVEQYMLLGGAQWRGPHNQAFSLNYHGYVGGSDGFFKSSLHGANPVPIGLFPNQIAPAAAVGISVDWNRSAHWAIRIPLDCYLTHFSSPVDGGEWEQTFGVGLGVVYRFKDK